MATPLDDAVTRQLYDDLAEADASLAPALLGVLGPLGGWVTVVDFAEDPQFQKVLWYICDPAEAIRHSHATDFHFDVDHGGPYLSEEYDAGEKTPVYHPIGSESVKPLAYLLTYGEGAPKAWFTSELADDFRLLWGLYEDSPTSEWKRVDENGSIEVGARRVGMRIEVRTKLLTRYLAARQLAAVGQAFCDRRGESIDRFVDRNEHAIGEMHSLHASGGTGMSSSTPWLWVWAKRALTPGPIETCEVWPFEPPDEHANFIIGHDDAGATLAHSADPERLSSYFEDKGTPHYLTPVHFALAVLDRYHSDTDRFTIRDGYVHGPIWGLPIDNDHSDRVIAYLGDLGKLPFIEQQHWRVHNLEPDGTISDTAFRRDFAAQFTDAAAPVWRLHRSREAADEAFRKRFGVSLYRTPHADDSHVGASVHMPTNNSMGAFDHEIVPLGKYTVDLLNEAGIESQFTAKPKDSGVKGIGKLEHLLEQEKIDDGGLTKALRDVYGVRTRSGAHSKGSDFDRPKLLGGATTLPERFEQMLTALADGYEALARTLGS